MERTTRPSDATLQQAYEILAEDAETTEVERLMAVQAEGEGTSHKLINAKTREVERHRLRFDFEPHASRVKVFETETAVQEFLDASGARSKLVVSGIPLPRLMYMNLYWPPTVESLKRAMGIQAQGGSPTFENVEGGDLGQAWNFLLDGDSLSAIPDDIPFKVYP